VKEIEINLEKLEQAIKSSQNPELGKIQKPER
jgi:translation elongation factor EF-1beta